MPGSLFLVSAHLEIANSHFSIFNVPILLMMCHLLPVQPSPAAVVVVQYGSILPVMPECVLVWVFVGLVVLDTREWGIYIKARRVQYGTSAD